MSRAAIYRMKYFLECATMNVDFRTYRISHVFHASAPQTHRKVYRGRAAEKELASPNTKQPTSNETYSDVDLVRRLGNDPDTFGTLSEKEIVVNHDSLTEIETGDKYETFRFQQNGPRRWQKYYVDLIKQYTREKKLKDAIGVLENKMLKEDGAKPAYYIYAVLITACAHAGYSKKAFQLYNQMKKRGLKVTAPIYTSLFNACANSPFPDQSLKLAVNLRNLMIEKGVHPNVLNYHAMIKAFGRCGDLATAFSLFDEMIAQKYAVKDDTFNNLFQACISDNNAGFFHVLLSWRKLLHMKVRPNVESYNLVIRAARDCSLGGNESAQELLQTITETRMIPSVPREKSHNIESKKLIGSSNINEIYSGKLLPNISEVLNEKLMRNTEGEKALNAFSVPNCEGMTEITLTEREYIEKAMPNFLAAEPNLGNVISLKEITKPEDRLQLLGGYSGVLEHMASMGIAPNIKTFTLLLDCTEATSTAENELISAMKRTKVKPDIDFFNMLIRRRNLRADYKAGNDVIKFVHQEKLVPNVMTFGVLAIGCQNDVEARSLIQDMQFAGYRMNAEILGALLGNACYHHNFDYVKLVMDTAKEEEIRPNKKFLETLEKFIAKCEKILQKKKLSVYDGDRIKLQKHFKTFKQFYKEWSKTIVPETEEHPWKQYRE